MPPLITIYKWMTIIWAVLFVIMLIKISVEFAFIPDNEEVIAHQIEYTRGHNIHFQ